MKITNLLKAFTFLVALLLTISCEEENLDIHPKQFGPKIDGKAIILKGGEHDKAVRRLTALMERSNINILSRNGRNLRTSQWTIDFSEVLLVTDTLGNNNFTYRVNHSNDAHDLFYNLVLTENSKTSKTTIKLVEYHMSAAFAKGYSKGEMGIHQFAGSIKFTPIPGNFLPDPEEPQDPEEEPEPHDPNANPCEDETVIYVPDKPTGGSGSGPSSGGGSSSGGGFSGDQDEAFTAYQPNCWVWIEVPCSYHTSGHYGNNASCTSTTFQGATYLKNMCTGQSIQVYRTANNEIPVQVDPCDPVGDIGVLEPVIDICNFTDASFNGYYSSKSPFKIDLSAVRPDCDNPSQDSDKVRFMCIYDKLVQSPTFKNFFVEMFGDSQILNVEFQISNTPLPNDAQANCQMFITNNNGVSTYRNVIKIYSEFLDEETSNIEIARILIHECVHAYLNVKLKNCNNGPSLEDINNLQLGELINIYYSNFTCAPNGQSQHSFMINHMLPTMKNCLSEIRDLLVSAEDRLNSESKNYAQSGNGFTLGSTPFNWNDFYYYFSLAGLHNTEEFTNTIASNQVQHHLFNSYHNEGFLYMTKTCD